MTAAKSKAKTPPKPTEYVVLQLVRDPGESKLDLWAPLKDGQTITAKSKTEAIKIASGDAEGTFKAVPLSSWKGGVTQAQTTMLKREAID